MEILAAPNIIRNTPYCGIGRGLGGGLDTIWGRLGAPGTFWGRFGEKSFLGGISPPSNFFWVGATEGATDPRAPGLEYLCSATFPDTLGRPLDFWRIFKEIYLCRGYPPDPGALGPSTALYSGSGTRDYPLLSPRPMCARTRNYPLLRFRAMCAKNLSYHLLRCRLWWAGTRNYHLLRLRPL